MRIDPSQFAVLVIFGAFSPYTPLRTGIRITCVRAIFPPARGKGVVPNNVKWSGKGSHIGRKGNAFPLKKSKFEQRCARNPRIKRLSFSFFFQKSIKILRKK